MSESDDQAHIVTESGPFAIVPVWVLELGLSGGELATYVAMRSFANRGSGEAHPHVKTIAERAGVQPRTAERAIARFKELGLLTSTRRYTRTGDIAGCTYYMRDVPLPAGARSAPPVRPVGTPPDEPVGTLPTAPSEQEQTRGTDQSGQTNNSSHARASDDRRTASELLAEEIVQSSGGRISAPLGLLQSLLAPALHNGVPRDRLKKAMHRMAHDGQRFTPWNLNDYVIKVAAGSSRLPEGW